MSKKYIILYGLFLAVLFSISVYAIYICSFYTTSDKLPTKNYSIHNDVCFDACKNINIMTCKEWTLPPYTHMCEFVCDTRVDEEITSDNKPWTRMFVCAGKAHSSKNLEDCGLSCTKMDDL